MSAVATVPELEWPHGYFTALALMVVSAGLVASATLIADR